MHSSAVISIGNEILLGKTLNSNLAYLASQLAAMGFPVEFSLTVKDDPWEIKNALSQCWQRFDIVISTGGLGPTTDDITKQVIAEFFGKKLLYSDEVWEQVQSRFSARNLPTPEINRNQALVPEGFQALQNERGTAPGLSYCSGGKCFFAFAGVPGEMKHVFDTHVKGILQAQYGSCAPIIQRTLHSFGISESALAEIVPEDIIPEGVSLAWLPQTGRVDLRLYGNQEASVDSTVGLIEPLVQDWLWGRDEDTPVSVLSELLLRKGCTISLAESCTGGLIQTMITSRSGASEIFQGGIVAYSNALKTKLLGVRETTLAEHGAVSDACAMEMATGIKSLTESAVAISITGVAGPSGGTVDKPVGTVYFGFSVLNDVWSVKQIFSGDREAIRHKAAEFAILHMIKHLQGKKI